MALTPATTASIPQPISYTRHRRTEALFHKTLDLSNGGDYQSPNRPRRLLVRVRGLEAPCLHLRPHRRHIAGVHDGKFMAYSINTVVLLTVGPVVLGLHASSDRPKGKSNKEYWVGFFITMAAVYVFILLLVEVMYKTAK
ncbi:hypothetical protein ACS0TY_016645 [Phlomoides rotata]